jgi:RNA polymerase sigma-70 factor (ECF subfamily)
MLEGRSSASTFLFDKSLSSCTTMPEPSENLPHLRDTQFVKLLTAHQRKLYAYIAAMLLGDSAAADVLQDTNLELWAKVNEYDFDRPFLPWAFGFARQKVLVFRRTHSRSRLVFGDEAFDMIHETCIQFASEADDRLVALRNCLKKLDPQQAELIRERYVAMTSVRSIASRLGETAQNISSRLHRIRKTLARCVEVTLATEER